MTATSALSPSPSTGRRPDPDRTRRTLGRVWYAGLGLLVLLGLTGVVLRFAHGMRSTDLTTLTPWGAWVSFYIFCVGLSAGAFFITTLSTVFSRFEFEPLVRPGLLLSIVSLGVGLGFIGLDLGRWERSLSVMWNFHWTSPLSWEVRFFVLYLILVAVQLALSLWVSWGRSKNPAEFIWYRRVFAIICLPVAVLGVAGMSGLLFAVVRARAMWFGAVLPVVTVISALVTGAAAMAVNYYAHRRLTGWAIDQRLVTRLAGILMLALCIDALITFFEFLVPLLSRAHEEVQVIKVLTTGPFWWSFWIFQLLLGLVIPIVILATPRTRTKPPWACVAGLSAVLGVIGVRFNIVLPAVISPVIDGFPTSYYFPTPSEWGAVLFLLAAGALAYTLLARFLDVYGTEDVLTGSTEANTKKVPQ